MARAGVPIQADEIVAGAKMPAGCPVTRSNGNVPPGLGNPDDRGGYGNDALWTNLWMWGTGGIPAAATASHLMPDGSYGELKWAWYRYTEGTLTIDGRRLDAPAPPLTAEIPQGYGSIGFQVSGINFPTAGCWEITGHLGDASLTFVIIVIAPDDGWSKISAGSYARLWPFGGEPRGRVGSSSL